MKIVFLFFATLIALSAQTTTVTASQLKDQSGNPVTGTFCFGVANVAAGAPGSQPNGVSFPCWSLTSGALSSSQTLANGIYAVWISSSSAAANQIFYLPSIALNGTAVAADTFLANQFAATVAGTAYYLTSLNTAITCNGNALTFPASPNTSPTAPQQRVQFINISTTTACSVSGNGNSIIYKGVSSSTANLPATATADAVWVVNYDQAGHNAWVVAHVGT